MESDLIQGETLEFRPNVEPAEHIVVPKEENYVELVETPEFELDF
jgi:hypothetical protein